MKWISTTYEYRDREGTQHIVTTHINISSIRRIIKTPNVWARVYWNNRFEPLTLNEEYEPFIARMENIDTE
jgi:hypothetical protein